MFYFTDIDKIIIFVELSKTTNNENNFKDSEYTWEYPN